MRPSTTITRLGALPSKRARRPLRSLKRFPPRRRSPSSASIGDLQLRRAACRSPAPQGDGVRLSDRRGSAFGQGVSTNSVLWPSASQQLSARCGIIGPIKQHERFQRLAPHRAVRRFRAAADGVGERVDLRDRAVETQRSTDRRSPRRWRDGVARRNSSAAPSACAIFAPGGGRFFAFVDQTPDALHETPAAFGAGFRPFDIALGRRVGEHEPADRVGAVDVDDRFGRDRRSSSTSTSSPTGR